MKRDLDHYLALNYPIEILREEGGVFAFHPDLDGCAAQGEGLEEAVANLDAARRLWIQTRLEEGLPIEEPVSQEECSGRVTLRMSPSLHAELLRISRRQRVSFNQLLNTALSDFAGGNRLQHQILELVQELRSGAAATKRREPQRSMAHRVSLRLSGAVPAAKKRAAKK